MFAAAKLALWNVPGFWVELPKNGLEQFIKSEAGIFTACNDKLTRIKALSQNGAGDRLAAADVACQHAQIHGFFAGQIEQPVKGLLMLRAAIIKSRVPRRLKRFRVELPMMEEVRHVS